MNVTDEMVEAAAKAMHDGPLGADDEAEYTSDTSNKAAEWCREMARAALQAALSLPSPPVGEIAEGGGETERLVRAKQWLQDRWSEKHPNTAHIRQLADYETFLRALSAAPASPANGKIAEGETLRLHKLPVEFRVLALNDRTSKEGDHG